MAEDIEELRRRRMQQLMAQHQQDAVQEQFQEAETSRQIKYIVDNILAPEARERLSNIRLARPQYARQIEVLLIQLKQAGRLPEMLSDADFKGILMKISGRKRESRIEYDRME